MNVNVLLTKLNAVKEADSATHVNRLRIQSSSSDRTYIISQRRTTQGWECGCPGWTRHRDRRCKHMTALKQALSGVEPELKSRFGESPKAPTKAVATAEDSVLLDLWTSLTDL